MESLTEELSGVIIINQNEGSILIFAAIAIIAGMLAALFLSAAPALSGSTIFQESKKASKGELPDSFHAYLLGHPMQMRWVLQGWGILFSSLQAVCIIPAYLYLLYYLHVGLVWQFLIFLVMFSGLILLEFLPVLYMQHQYQARFIRIILPFLKVYWKISKSLLLLYERSLQKRLESFQSNQPITMSELSETIEMHDEENPGEAKILKSIVEFGEVEVKEVMKSRGEVVTVDLDFNFKHLIEVIVQCGYSRMPVIDQTFDQVAGILYIKDILPHLHEDEAFNWHILIRKPYFTNESKLLSELLEEFRSEKNHIAVVVDEYGGTSGIITLEDILEEIVGDITDEMDEEEVDFSHPEPNRYLFNGKTLLNDFLRIVGEESDYYDDFRGEMESLAGLLLEKFREIPPKGAEIQIRDYLFRIKSADMRRIKQIEVQVLKQAN